jgi:hypothetical protein
VSALTQAGENNGQRRSGGPVGEMTVFSIEVQTCPVHSDCQAASRARQVNGALAARQFYHP